MVTITINLPWFSKLVSPNARTHWRRKGEAVKKMRREAALMAKQGIPKGWVAKDHDAVPMTITFCPPDGRRRDRDNMIASIKAYMDGIADALGVDDSIFIPTYHLGQPINGGNIRVEIA